MIKKSSDAGLSISELIQKAKKTPEAFNKSSSRVCFKSEMKSIKLRKIPEITWCHYPLH